MKFQDLPKDAQHHALSTLRELMVVGGENESGADIAAKVKAAFVSMYNDADTTTHTGTIDIKLGGIPAGTPSIEEAAQGIASATLKMLSSEFGRYVTNDPKIVFPEGITIDQACSWIRNELVKYVQLQEALAGKRHSMQALADAELLIQRLSAEFGIDFNRSDLQVPTPHP